MSQDQLAAPVVKIVERLRRARLVCNDETSARRPDPVGVGVPE